MKNFCVYGTIGSGKTVFCKKILMKKNIPQYFPLPIFHVEIDEIVRFWKRSSSVKKNIYHNWRNYGVNIYSSSNDERELKSQKNILFFSSVQQRERAWNILEQIFHPMISRFISLVIKKKRNMKGTLLWDMALPELFLKNYTDGNKREGHSFIHIPSKSLYETLFLLKKYRNFSYKKTIFFLRKQKGLKACQ